VGREVDWLAVVRERFVIEREAPIRLLWAILPPRLPCLTDRLAAAARSARGGFAAGAFPCAGQQRHATLRPQTHPLTLLRRHLDRPHLYNGHIRTLDSALPIASALALAGERIVAVGDDSLRDWRAGHPTR
jgi:hypothetical protein